MHDDSKQSDNLGDMIEIGSW